MELDEMKCIWLALEKKLDKELNFRNEQMREILQSKVNQSLGKLTGSEISEAIVALLALPVLVWFWETRMDNNLFFKVFMIYLIAFCIIGSIWQAMKAVKLMKINHTKPLCANIRNMEHYKIWIKKEKLYGVPAALVGIFLFFPCIMKAPVWVWITYISATIAAVSFGLWQYKKTYDTHIKSISESLEKLRDMDCC